MWPSTLYPEKTYRFLKNVYDNYGGGRGHGKKSQQSTRMGLEQQQSVSSPSSGASTPQLERSAKILGGHHPFFNHPRHSLPSPPPSIFSSSSSDVACNSGPSTPSSSALIGRHRRQHSYHYHHQNKTPPPPMTRLFEYSKSVATDMKHRFHAHISRLPKIESTEDSSDQESIDSRDLMAPSSVDHRHRHHPHLSPAGGGGGGREIAGHQPLYYRASSPVFEQRLMYAASTRLHHSEPQTATASALARQRPLCDPSGQQHFLLPGEQTALVGGSSSSGNCQRTSPSLSMSANGGKSAPAGHHHEHHHHFGQHPANAHAAAAAALSARRSPQSSAQRRLSSSAYRSSASSATYDTDGLLPSSQSSGARTVLLDKFASDVDVHNRDIGGLTLCGGREVGKHFLLLLSLFFFTLVRTTLASIFLFNCKSFACSAVLFLLSSSLAHCTACSELPTS